MKELRAGLRSGGRGGWHVPRSTRILRASNVFKSYRARESFERSASTLRKVIRTLRWTYQSLSTGIPACIEPPVPAGLARVMFHSVDHRYSVFPSRSCLLETYSMLISHVVKLVRFHTWPLATELRRVWHWDFLWRSRAIYEWNKQKINSAEQEENTVNSSYKVPFHLRSTMLEMEVARTRLLAAVLALNVFAAGEAWFWVHELWSLLSMRVRIGNRMERRRKQSMSINNY